MTAATVCSFCLDPARLKCGRCGEPFCAARCFGQSAHAATCGGAGAVGMPRGGGEGRGAARDSPESFGDLLAAIDYFSMTDPNVVTQIRAPAVGRVSTVVYRVNTRGVHGDRHFVAIVKSISDVRDADLFMEDPNCNDFEVAKEKSCIQIGRRVTGDVWLDLVRNLRDCGIRSLDHVFAIVYDLLTTLRFNGHVYLHDALSYDPAEDDGDTIHPAAIARLLARTKQGSAYAKYGFVAVDPSDDPEPRRRDLAKLQAFALTKNVPVVIIADVKHGDKTLRALAAETDDFSLVDRPLADVLEYFVPTPLKRRLTPVDVRFYRDLIDALRAGDKYIKNCFNDLDNILYCMSCKDYRESWKNIHASG